MLILAVATALGLGQPALGTYARHPSSTSFRACQGKLGETYSHLGRLSGAFGDSASFFLGCSDGDSAPWVIVAALVCQSAEESFCPSTDQLKSFTSFSDMLQPGGDIHYRFSKYSVGENCKLDHDAGGVWACRTWVSRLDPRGAVLTTSGGEMKLDDNWSVDDRTDARDEDFTLEIGRPSER